eukprot:6169888-Lingulodinium_polyedra.AAC.1
MGLAAPATARTQWKRRSPARWARVKWLGSPPTAAGPARGSGSSPCDAQRWRRLALAETIEQPEARWAPRPRAHPSAIRWCRRSPPAA